MDNLYVEIGGTPEDADRFLNDILEDERLRSQLSAGASSAAAALRGYGINISPELLDEPVELPPPEELREAIDSMDLGEFTSDVVMIRFWPIFHAMLTFRRFRGQAS